MAKNNTLSPKSSDPFYTVTYYIKLVTTFWTDGNKGVPPVDIAAPRECPAPSEPNRPGH